ncbi:hypothetical protein [Lacinutrix salivirga]
MGILGKLFGNKHNEEALEDDNYVTAIIEAGENEPLAISNSNVMYAGYNELGGYYFLQTAIIGSLKTKTKEGAQLIIEGNDYTLKLNSDMPELESNEAKPLNAHVTNIDFEIEKEAVEGLKRSTMKQLTLKLKKQDIVFTVYNTGEEE